MSEEQTYRWTAMVKETGSGWVVKTWNTEYFDVFQNGGVLTAVQKDNGNTLMYGTGSWTKAEKIVDEPSANE